MLALLIFAPLILSAAIFLWFLPKIYTHNYPNKLLSVFQGQERLSRVFWKYGVIGYPLFFIAFGGLIYTGGDIYLGHPLFTETRGPDNITQRVIFWCCLAFYRLGWSLGIFLCRKNTEKKVFEYTALFIACAISAIIFCQFVTVIKVPSIAEAVAQCRKDPSLQKTFEQQRIEFEAENEKLEDSPLNNPAHYEAILEERRMPKLLYCAHDIRENIWENMPLYPW